MSSSNRASNLGSPSSAGAPPIYTRNATGLVREIRILDQVVYNLGAVTPLVSGLIVVYFSVAAFPQSNLFLAVLIPAVLSIPVWVTFALMTSVFPVTGGDYVYNSRILHPAIGFAVNVGWIFSLPLVIGFGAGFLPELGLYPTLSIIGTVTNNATISSWASNFAVTNGTGVFLTAVASILFICVLASIRTWLLFRVMTIMVAIFAVAVVVDIIILLTTSNADFISYFNHLIGPNAYQHVVDLGRGKGLYPSEGGYSVTNTIGAMFFCEGAVIWVFQGAYIAGEVRRAGSRRRMLTSMIAAGALQTAVILLALYAFYHAVGENFAISAAAGNQSSGLATWPYYAALAANSPWIAVLLAIGFLFWALPTLNVYTAVLQRAFFVYSFEGLLPDAFSRVNAKTHTPILAIGVMGAVGVVGAALDAYNGNFGTALTIAELFAFPPLIAVGIAAIVMPYRRPDLFKNSQADWRIGRVPVLVVAGVGTVLVCGASVVMPFIFAQQTGLAGHSWLPWVTGVAPFVALAVGFVWWQGAKRVQARKGVDLDLLYKTIPPD